MTRRDIIIIAVLVNAGLLAILFMMAITTDEDKISEPSEVVSFIEEVKPIEIQPYQTSENASTNPTDEVDLAIEAYKDPSNSTPVIIDEDNALDLDQDDDMPIIDPQPVEPEAEPAPVAPAKPVVKATTTTSKQKQVEVTVKRGDSLDKIARANGTTIKAIKQANDLKSDRLDIGQVLKVPVSTEKKSTTKTTTTTTTKKADKQIAQSDSQYYTVKNGDNPWKIAKQFKIKVDDFLKLNDLNEEKARNLKVGDKVRVK